MAPFARLIAAVLFVLTPAEFAPDYTYDSAGPLASISDAVVRVQLVSHVVTELHGEAGATHRAVVLGIFKPHVRLPAPGNSMILIEPDGLMQTEDGWRPPWDTSKPLPAGTDATAFMTWDSSLNAFRMVYVWQVRFDTKSNESAPIK